MRTPILAAALAMLAMIVPMTASAGPISAACQRSDRQAAGRAICACIQQAADMTLTGADQRRAAKFFADPEEAQQTRMSTSDRDNAFWDRYKTFTATAEAYCVG